MFVYLCVYVSPLACTSQKPHNPNLKILFSARYPWPWLGRPMMAVSLWMRTLRNDVIIILNLRHAAPAVNCTRKRGLLPSIAFLNMNLDIRTDTLTNCCDFMNYCAEVIHSSCIFLIFTARCTIVQSAVLLSHVVCPSVCLSATLVDHDHIGWKSWKLIAQTTRSTSSLFMAKRSSTYSQGNWRNFGETRGGVGKSGVLEHKSGNIFETR